MTAAQWQGEVERQGELLKIEEDVVLDLLEEIHEMEIDPANVRNLSDERTTLKRHLTVLAGERVRLDREIGTLERGDPPFALSVSERGRPLCDQLSRVGQLLGEWQKENGQGRMRRMRDHVWLDALLLEKARLQAEQRRIEAQRGAA